MLHVLFFRFSSREKKEFLIVAQRNQISRVDLKDNSVDKLPVSNLTNVVAIEFDMKNNCVYWADIRQEIIGVSNLYFFYSVSQ